MFQNQLMTDAHSEPVTFASLGLVDEVMAGIKQAGFVNCTPIQAQTLPIALAGRDVAGQAQTGTGKTAAFLVAMYQTLLTRPAAPNRQPTSVRALIVAPTRELAVQIHHDALTLGAHTGLRHTVVFGGIDYEKQRTELASGCGADRHARQAHRLLQTARVRPQARAGAGAR